MYGLVFNAFVTPLVVLDPLGIAPLFAAPTVLSLLDGIKESFALWLADRFLSLTSYNPCMGHREEPHGPIVVVGGYMAWPVSYRGLARILAKVSGSEVYVVPITPLDWALGRVRGYGQLVFEVATTVDKALLESDSDRAVLVGYSAGGILARVYIGGDPPYGGRRYSGHRRVSHLITLGTPHNVPAGSPLTPISEVNELFPGALHESIRYLCVAGAAADGASSRRVRRRYERFVSDGQVKGDGQVPVESALLPGAEALVLGDLHHSRWHRSPGSRWYGSDRRTVECWWPGELRVRERLVEGRRS